MTPSLVHERNHVAYIGLCSHYCCLFAPTVCYTYIVYSCIYMSVCRYLDYYLYVCVSLLTNTSKSTFETYVFVIIKARE